MQVLRWNFLDSVEWRNKRTLTQAHSYLYQVLPLSFEIWLALPKYKEDVKINASIALEARCVEWIEQKDNNTRIRTVH